MIRPAALLACAILFAPPPEAVTQTPVEPGRAYAGGERLTSPLTGVTFTLPEGLQAEWDREVRALVAASPDMLGAVWAVSEGTAEEVADEVGALLAGAGIRLSPRAELEFLPDGLRGDFDALSTEGAGVLHAEVRVGTRGGAVAVAALGAPDDADRLRRFVSDVTTSLEWSTPGAASWRGEVEGAVLTWTGGGSDLSTGTTTATGASSSTASIALCGGGLYRYEESSESYISIMGASASSSSGDTHAGQWWLVADLAGGATLLLEATDGRYFRWPVEEAGEAFLIDGYRYTLTGGC